MSLINPTLAVADTNNQRVLLYPGPLTSGSTAAVVLGQRDLLHSQQNLGKGTPSAHSLDNPSSVITDADGNLFVADTGNSRVLIFRPPFTTGMAASVVIGEPDFASLNPSGAAAGLLSPSAMTLDSKGDLWVADVGDARVLEYKPPFQDGMEASLAIGQSSTSAVQVCSINEPTVNNLCSPNGLTFDAAGNLWISDSDFNRVLQFAPPFSSGMSASLEIGQPASAPFTSNTARGPAADSLSVPTGLAFDAAGNLWLSDMRNNRVLEYTPPFLNGMAASSVVGQTDFTHGGPNQDGSQPSAGTLSSPWGLSFDKSGNLIVADLDNNRILTYAVPLTTGAAAASVLGQPGFTDASVNQGGNQPSGGTLFHPFSTADF